MAKKYKEPLQPNSYRLALDCLHQPIMTPEEIKNAKVESKFNGKSYDDMIVCPSCARHERGSCDQYRIIHRVVSATPLYSIQVSESKQPQPQEQAQQQEQTHSHEQ